MAFSNVTYGMTVNESMLTNDTGVTTMSPEMLEYEKQCKSRLLPTAKEIVNSMDIGDLVYHVILILMATVVVALFIEEVFFMKAHIKQAARRRMTYLQLGIPPVFAVSSVVGTFFPAGTLMIDFVTSVYFGFALHGFLVLLVNYFNGLRQLLLRYDKKKCVIHTGPFCCCCLCLPDFKMSKRNFNVIWYATFQAALTRPVVLFFKGVFFTDREHSVPIPGLFYTLFLLCSMLTGMWALVILRRSAGDFLARYRVTAKFFNFQLVLLIANLQSFIINKTHFKCNLPYTVLANKLILNYQITIIEFFVLGLTTRFLYHKESDNALLELITPKKADDSEDKNHNTDVLISEKLQLTADENGLTITEDVVTSVPEKDNRTDDIV